MNFRKEIEIEATPKRVWELMKVLPAWPDWNPTISKIELLGKKPTGVGTKLKIDQPNLPSAVWTITEWTPYEGFVMVKGSYFLKVSLLHEIEPTSLGTKAILSIVFSGLFAAPVVRRYGALMEEYLSLEADSLKKGSESFSHHFQSK